MRRKRTWIIVGIVVVLIVGGIVVVTNSQRSAAQAAQANVQTGACDRGHPALHGRFIGQRQP